MTLERLNRWAFYSPAAHAGGPNERGGRAGPGVRAARAGPGSRGGGVRQPWADTGRRDPSGVELRG